MANKAYPFYTADVFSDRPFGGNPLAVFPVADGMSDQQMLAIAQEFNLSETVFVQLPRTPRADRRLRIFTPTGEIPFAGHPTLGAAAVLALIGEIPATSEETTLYLEEDIGFIPVKIRVALDQPVFAELMVDQPPTFDRPPADLADLAKAIGLTPEDFLDIDVYPPVIGSCGLPFLILPLKTVDALERSRLNTPHWEQHLANTHGAHLYPITPTIRDQWRVRMYAPALGISEDPATGSAATVLGGYLARYGDRAPLRDGTHHWQVEQGIEMGRPSSLSIQTTIRDGNIMAIRVGGQSTLMSKGQFLLPELE